MRTLAVPDNQATAFLVSNDISMVHMETLTSSYQGTDPKRKQVSLLRNKYRRMYMIYAADNACPKSWLDGELQHTARETIANSARAIAISLFSRYP